MCFLIVVLQGKMSRVLAAKCALSIRVDAMGDSPEPTIGLESRQMVRSRSGSFVMPGGVWLPAASPTNAL